MGRIVTAEGRLESTLKRFGVSSNENKTALLIGNNVWKTDEKMGLLLARGQNNSSVALL